MAWTVDASGSKTATVPSTATFTNGSANIGLTNTCAAGDMVVLSTSSALPTNFTAGTVYYVIATSLSSSNIQLSATPGGSAITAGSAGTGTQTATVEHVVDQPNTNGTYVFDADTVNLANGDLVEFRCYDMVDGTNYRQMWKATFQHLQINNGKCSPPFPVTTQAQFTIKQLSGTGRAFPWSVRRI